MSSPETQYPVVRSVARALGWTVKNEGDDSGWDVFWTDKAIEPDFLSSMKCYQKVNHFPGMYVLSRKNNLAKVLTKLKKQFPQNYSFFPQTWLLPADYGSLKQFVSKTGKGKARTFIVKPQASCQGRGIYLTRAVQKRVDKFQNCVVQKYITRPYLINGLKFDLRIYVLVAACAPLRLYIYEEGLVRFATVPYASPNKDNLQELCMHLTNYAINKDNPDFIPNTSQSQDSVGHKQSLSALYSRLQSQGKDTVKLKGKIEEIVVLTLLAGQPILSHQYNSCQADNYQRNMCFQILGFDIMLDQQLTPYLLEVNHTPSFTTDSPLDFKIKFDLIKHTLLLMNVNIKKRRSTIVSNSRMSKMRISGVKKPSIEEKLLKVQQMQALRDQFESANLNGFKKIYPVESQLYSAVEKVAALKGDLQHKRKHYRSQDCLKGQASFQSPEKTALSRNQSCLSIGKTVYIQRKSRKQKVIEPRAVSSKVIPQEGVYLQTKVFQVKNFKTARNKFYS